MDWKKIHNIHMIGIKGVGMTMLAQFLASQGYEISGSDTEEKFMTDKILRKAGIKVSEHFAKANIRSDVDLIIYSSAYKKETNPELKYALTSQIPVIRYAQAVGEVFNQHQGIAVTGSHGKTTTSAWLAFVANGAGLSPKALIGSNVPQFRGSGLNGSSNYLIAEADEYQNKLKYFNPWMVLLNNIDHDHHDFFKTKQKYVAVFREFIKRIPSRGSLIANFDDPEVRRISKYSPAKIVSYGLGSVADYQATNLRIRGEWQYFDLSQEKNFRIRLRGRHNISNALAVIAASRELGISWEKIKSNLAKFRGTERRLEFLGEYQGAKIIDDYAHHPTEIRSTLEAVREAYEGRVITVFHPHTYTRTRNLLKEFSQSFAQSDELIVLDIYGSAREKKGGVSSLDLIRKIEKYNNEESINQKIKHIPDLDKCTRHLRKYLQPGDVLLLMGAGDVFRVGQKLLGKL